MDLLSHHLIDAPVNLLALLKMVGLVRQANILENFGLYDDLSL